MPVISIEEPRKTTRSYASRVFQESSVGVVSSLAHTTSKRRRVYKIIAFLLCLFGFLYQSGTFLAAVLEYPTTVGINIKRPDILTVPAFTFCDNNGLNRKLFCRKFPDRCEKPTEAYCKKYSDYCTENKSLVPKREYFSLHGMMDLEDMIELNNKKDHFVQITGDFINGTLTGPYPRLRDGIDTLMCYSLFDRVNNSLPLFQSSKQNNIMRKPVVKFDFNVFEDETFLPGNRPGVLFAIHNQYEAVNPFEVGIFMKPGRRYMIFVSVDEEVLLPKPYITNCVNYTQVWEKNGRIGPRMQDMCRQKCLAELSIKCFNCVRPEVLFGAIDKYCSPEESQSNKSCSEDYLKQFEECSSKCGDDCRQTKFSYTIQERFSAHFGPSGEEIEDLHNVINAQIYLEGEEIVELKHSPKYMFVEVFSNIGGFIGCWLGINLLDITDIMDGFFRIIRYSLKRL